MNDAGDLRVSDEQREQAAQQIREHFAAGRLDEQELSERLQSAYGARTEQELRGLLADLPPLPAPPEQVRLELALRRGHLQRRLLQSAGGGIAAFVVCTVIWLVSGAHGHFWPIWIALVTLIPLLRGGWLLYGPSPQPGRVERELEERERHAERRAARRHRY